VPQRTAEVGLATAAGPGDQEVLATLQPVSLSEPRQLALVDAARVLVVDGLQAGTQLEAGLTCLR